MKGSSCEQVRQHFRDGWYVGVHRFPGVRRSVVEWLHRVLAAHGVVAVNNLRDWQKKASERREALAQKVSEL
jgi:RNA-binding protein YhbY